MSGDTYHHGNLRRAVLDAAVEAIGEAGPAGWSLRELARRAGVSHAAPAHHFGDKTGLLTAVAAEGYALFAEALEAAGDLHEAGLAYVRFAVGHRAHFEVMFTPALYRAGDPELGAARERARLALAKGVRGAAPERPGDDRTAGIAAWSIVHGFAHLWLSGALQDLGDDPVEAADPVIRLLFER
ncbi:TetR/AcrR family transcriptional regulator [Actinomadura darangshiensis]|uniref:TetR/AcrR family transcriptional regulator n=1 Tax=Actinomadura darangshiensis TaxID=705336 RepID=A0A4R5ABA9_9ACTN|nr:TetR-like C-terminal domain-containing protein [Actinomadura darangshiensis]TDD67042.1 TetR/AcrR family transcriptional regulator [Actinomadura darangshiensis]